MSVELYGQLDLGYCPQTPIKGTMHTPKEYLLTPKQTEAFRMAILGLAPMPKELLPEEPKDVRRTPPSSVDITRFLKGMI